MKGWEPIFTYMAGGAVGGVVGRKAATTVIGRREGVPGEVRTSGLDAVLDVLEGGTGEVHQGSAGLEVARPGDVAGEQAVLRAALPNTASTGNAL